jgi:outer membrane protein assembly factor BamA
MKKLIILIILLNLFSFTFAQYPAPNAEEIQRSQELIDKETMMLERIQKGDKFFIKKILIDGFTLISKTELKDIIIAYQGRWLTKDDLGKLDEEIKQVYRKKGYTTQPKDISYHIKGKILEIYIED